MDIENLTIDLIKHLAGINAQIERRDRDLGNQIRRAATSIALNVAEGRKRELDRISAICYRLVHPRAGARDDR